MATGTAQVVPGARQDPRQVLNTLKRTLNFNDPDIAKAPFDNALPAGSFVTRVFCEIVTAFNAGTTNPITVGTNGPATYNNLLASGDITGATPAVYMISAASTAKLGRAFAASGDVIPYAVYAPTGTAATTGQAVIVIEYEGGWAS